jgi:cytohesin
MVQALLAKGANPNAADRVSVGTAVWTTCPLNAAVHRGEAPLVKLLLSKGADPNGIPGASATPLYTAAWEAGMLYISTTTGATRSIDPQIIDDLIAAGAGVDQAVNGAPLVIFEKDDIGKADAAVSGLQGNSQGMCPKGATPLHAAAMLGTTRWTSYYLGKGANPNAKNEYGMTPLHEAATRGKKFAIVKALIAAGADVNAKTNSGATPLHGAAAQTWPDVRDVVKLLISSGASKTEKDASGKTPRDIATEADNTELLGLL